MAEKGAHLTLTVNPRPSIFELLAQESLNETIQQTVHRLFQFFLSSKNAKYEWLTDYYNEIYLTTAGILQYFYLRKEDASFSEYFYGLKRVSENGKSLSLAQKKYSFIILTLMPYFKNKLEEKIMLYKLQLADGVLVNDWDKRMKQYLCWSYSSFNLVWNLCSILQYLKYMSGSTETQTLPLRLSNMKLIYADPQVSGSIWSALFNRDISIPKLVLLSQMLSSTLELGAFFIRFLQYWHNENPRHVSVVPKPPEHQPKASQYQGTCPICYQALKIPTLIPVSGYIYCFSCVIRHLHEQKSCPVTGLPANITDIVRLYDD